MVETIVVGSIVCIIAVICLLWIFFKAINSDNSHSNYHTESWADIRYRVKLERQLNRR